MNNVTSGIKNSGTEYPVWYCPVLFCPYKTEYIKNVGIHLREVHFWEKTHVNLEKLKFRRASYRNKSKVNAWVLEQDEGADLGSEAFVGGGGGG